MTAPAESSHATVLFLRIRQALSCSRATCGCKRKGQNFHCPAHDDRDPSLTVNLEDHKLLVHCKGGCSQDAVISTLRERGLWFQPQIQKTTASPGEARWEIKAQGGETIATHVRLDLPGQAKRFFWERDGTNGLAGMSVSSLPLYGSNLLGPLSDSRRVVLTEGEKAADSLNARGLLAIGTVTGAGSTPGDEALRIVADHPVVLWPDNDDVGRRHMERCGTALLRLGCRDVRQVDWQGAPRSGDAADFVGDEHELTALLESARPFQASESSDLGALLADTCATIRKYVVLNDNQAVAIALWTAHTHVIDAAEVTPYLYIHSPEKRSGKSRLLEVLKHLVARPWKTDRTTTAALYRKLDAEGSTLLMDESDAAFKGAGEYVEALRGILNSGFERGGSATVCVGQGKNISYRDFYTFGAKAIAGIGRNLPDTVADRSIPIAMKRQSPSEKAYKLRRKRFASEATPLRDRLEHWAVGAVAGLADWVPLIPDELDDRAADGWEPLLAIAEMAAGNWPERARRAALSLSVGDREEDSLNVRLLADIWSIFEVKHADRIPIADLVNELVAIEDAPWSDLRGRPLNSRSLGWRLKGYQIRAQTIRLDADTTTRGYYRETFSDAVSRYLPGRVAQTGTNETSDTKRRDGFESSGGLESDTSPETDTRNEYDVAVVTSVAVPDGENSSALCAICQTGVDGNGGFLPDGEPRCLRHYPRSKDGPLVAEAVLLGGRIVSRQPVDGLTTTR